MSHSAVPWLRVLVLGVLAHSIASSATITGRVIDSSSGLPVPNITVAFRRDNDTTNRDRSAKTDSAGRYSLIMERGSVAGYLSAGAPGSREYVTRRIAIRDSDISGVDLRLPAWAKISGRVLDENRMPVAKADVFLIVQRFAGDTLTYILAKPSSTDAQGRYRFDELEPGRSYWLMTWLPSEVSKSGSIVAYYPGAPDMSGGLPFMLGPGQSRESVDITVRTRDRDFWCVDGRAGSAADVGPFHLQVDPSEIRGEVYGFPLSAAVTQPDGTFRVCGLSPGSWRILLYRGAAHYPEARGEQVVRITDSDIHDVNLTVNPRLATRVEVLDEAKPLGAQPADQINISLTPFPFYPANFQRTVSVPGLVIMDGMLPGDYVAVPWGAKGRLYVKDILHGDRSALNRSFRVLPDSGQANLKVLVARDGGYLHVQATDKDRNPVPDSWIAVIPVECITDADVAANYISGQTDQAGMWTSDALRPGKYYVFAAPSQPARTPEIVRRMMVLRLNNDPVEITADGDIAVTREQQF